MEEHKKVCSDEGLWVRGKCIGKGSFGTVNLAVMKSDGHVFAVKSVERNASLSSSQVEALENEICILRSLSSPHVVKYLGDDVTTSYRNLRIEYLPRGTVADVAMQFRGKVGDVDERVVRTYTWCILSALRYVHSKNIVHCDVKGKNILVGPAPGMAKLADFGAAKEITGEISHRKSHIIPRGSPLWMAPEVIRREYQGPESDVWSLGCTVIEMITGKPAWEDQGVDTLCRIGFSDELPEFPTQLSELGRDFLGKCLRREPSERWGCDQLLQHPFVSSLSANTMTDSSPRCVLDSFTLDFSDEDEEDVRLSLNCDFDNTKSNVEVQAIAARAKIMELASSNRGKIWESDGWLTVRNLDCNREEGAGASCYGEDEGERTNSEYPVFLNAEEEIAGTTSEYSDSTWPTRENERTSLEYFNSGGSNLLEWRYNNGCGGWKAGSSWRDGSGRRDLAVEMREEYFYSWCKLLLFLFHMIIFRLNLLNYYLIYFLFMISFEACECAQLSPRLRAVNEISLP